MSATFCDACEDALMNLKRNSRHLSQAYGRHHGSLESFRDAVASGCAICVRLQAEWASDSCFRKARILNTKYYWKREGEDIMGDWLSESPAASLVEGEEAKYLLEVIIEGSSKKLDFSRNSPTSTADTVDLLFSPTQLGARMARRGTVTLTWSLIEYLGFRQGMSICLPVQPNRQVALLLEAISCEPVGKATHPARRSVQF